jgi:hypothetical protein
MRLMAALISLFVLGDGQPQTLPPPFPRHNAVKLLDNDRVQVWSVAWPNGQPTPLHRHIYDITGTSSGLTLEPPRRSVMRTSGTRWRSGPMAARAAQCF